MPVKANVSLPSRLRHSPIVPAENAVAVKVLDIHILLDEVEAGRRVRLDRAGWADVIGRHRVAENRESTRSGDVARLSGSHAEAGKERRLLDVSRLGIPR